MNTSTAPLTAAEALILREPNKSQGRAALKLTMIDLLARRAVSLRHETRKGFLGRTVKTDYVQLAPDAARRAPAQPHVRAVLQALAAAGAGEAGATMPRIVEQARKAFGSGLSDFQSKHVVPALIQRRLLEAYQAKVLLLFSVTRYRHTPAGQAALDQIEEQIARARAIPAYLDRDPAQAAALALALGSTLLLVDELKPHYARLSAELRRGGHAGDGGDAYFHMPDGGDSSLSAGDSFDFDLDAFDALDSSLDAFDSGFDAADSGGDGGDGGGDGGGGD